MGGGAGGSNESSLLAGDRQRLFQRVRFRIDAMERRRRSAAQRDSNPLARKRGGPKQKDFMALRDFVLISNAPR